MGQGNAKEISLGDNFGDVALKVNGAIVEVHADGSVTAHTMRDVDAYTNASVRVHASANDSCEDVPRRGPRDGAFFSKRLSPANEGAHSEKDLSRGRDGRDGAAPIASWAEKAEPQVGDNMPAGHPNAGWVYAGISKTTHQPFYVAPRDSGVFQWKEAMAFAAKEGSRVPSKEELDQICAAREQGALKGTFNVTGSNLAGWYWSSSQDGSNYAWAQRFSDGTQDFNNKDYDASLRLVR